MIPKKLQDGDEVRIIAPSRSIKIISKDSRDFANQRFEELGLKLTFGKYVEESDEFLSSPVDHRLEDLHDAFSDKNVKAVLTVIGGFNSNQLLKHIDYSLIQRNPKILCGYSDITALSNAIFAKTGLVGYSGPHYSTFAMQKRFEFTLEHFKKCLFYEAEFDLMPSELWSDDAWYLDQNNRNFITNPGYLVLNSGSAKGTLIGGNLCTLNLLQGTEFMPSLNGAILFLEDDELSGSFTDVNFERDLQSLLHLKGSEKLKGLIIGRFQKNSQITEAKLRKIVNKPELKNIPIIAGVDFGHTDPYITFPIGGEVEIHAHEIGTAKIRILTH